MIKRIDQFLLEWAFSPSERMKTCDRIKSMTFFHHPSSNAINLLDRLATHPEISTLSLLLTSSSGCGR